MLVQQGKPEEALHVLSPSTNEAFRLQVTALAHHALGQEKESREALASLIAKHAHAAAYQIAGVYAFAGDKDRAFDWLELARRQHDAGLTMLQGDRLMQSIRDDRRYDQLLQELNLHRP